MSGDGERRAHEMPFGAQIARDGGVLFRLWAPTAARVDLCLDDAPEGVALTGTPDGWWRGHATAAAAGTRYRFRIDGGRPVPDPASRMQADDVHGASVVVDPHDHRWHDTGWRGRPWHEAVLYELHVGAFTPAGTFAAAAGQLDRLRDLGVTALQLMPVADFPGRRNWGYDGVLPFAPDRAYGTPDDLKALVDAAHARELMVFLDVVYNHFGPDGNYLWTYARDFFTDRNHTPWGAAIDMDGPRSRTVRDFFIHNALYWLDEYRLDGLRLDAVDRILDDSSPHVLTELARRVADGPGRERHVHLVLENDDNAASLLERGADGAPLAYTAQWNDDLHHALHVLLTGESGGYYRDFVSAPARRLGRALAEGFAYQGEPSLHRDGRRRGEPSAHLPPTAFVGFLQNHDQVGNRPLGERLIDLVAGEAPLHAALAVLLLCPQPPLLFMGEELGCRQPFPFFCDFERELGRRVRDGRRHEFASWPEFEERAAGNRLPDPNAGATFRMAVLQSLEPMTPEERRWRERYRTLLALRHAEIVPRLPLGVRRAAYDTIGDRAVEVRWSFGDGARLTLRANLGDTPAVFDGAAPGAVLYRVDPSATNELLPGWSVVWRLATDAPALEAVRTAEATQPWPDSS